VVERLSNEPLPPARPTCIAGLSSGVAPCTAHEQPTRPVQWCYMTQRIPDGDGVKGERPRLRLATREVWIGCLIVLIVIAAIVVRILR
jgi:hypothetical protein